MITNWILDVLVGLLRGVISLAPTWSFTLGDLSAAAYSVGQTATVLNGYFPLATLAACIGVIVAAKLGAALWSVLMWAYEKFPFKAT